MPCASLIGFAVSLGRQANETAKKVVEKVLSIHLPLQRFWSACLGDARGPGSCYHVDWESLAGILEALQQAKSEQICVGTAQQNCQPMNIPWQGSLSRQHMGIHHRMQGIQTYPENSFMPIDQSYQLLYPAEPHCWDAFLAIILTKSEDC